MTIRYLVAGVLNRVNVFSNVSSGAPEKNVNDVTDHIENQGDCLAEPFEAQTVKTYHPSFDRLRLTG